MRSILQHIFKNRRHQHFIDHLAGINSGISAVALLPQLFSLLGGQSAEGLSSLSFFLIATNSVIWLLYGIHRNMPPVIISSLLNAVVSVGILLLIVSG